VYIPLLSEYIVSLQVREDVVEIEGEDRRLAKRPRIGYAVSEAPNEELPTQPLHFLDAGVDPAWPAASGPADGALALIAEVAALAAAVSPSSKTYCSLRPCPLRPFSLFEPHGKPDMYIIQGNRPSWEQKSSVGSFQDLIAW